MKYARNSTRMGSELTASIGTILKLVSLGLGIVVILVTFVWRSSSMWAARGERVNLLEGKCSIYETQFDTVETTLRYINAEIDTLKRGQNEIRDGQLEVLKRLGEIQSMQ